MVPTITHPIEPNQTPQQLPVRTLVESITTLDTRNVPVQEIDRQHCLGLQLITNA